MITVWIVVALAVVVVVIAIATSWRRRDAHADLGAVSSQWISEQDQGHHHRQ